MLSQTDLSYIIDLVRSRSGITLSNEKSYLVESRLAPVARRLGVAEIADLATLVRRAPSGEPARLVVEAITTHESSFFRDPKTFEHLIADCLPNLIKARKPSRRLRFWSAACAFGQEAVSLAIALSEMGAGLDGWAIDIVGTDISQAAVDRCRNGTYSTFEVDRGLSQERRERWFLSDQGAWRTKEDLRRRFSFNIHNLLADDPALGTFDVVFLRNVLIYFDRSTKLQVLSHVRRRMAPDAYLILGGTEELSNVTADLEPEGSHRSFYRRVMASADRSPVLLDN